MDEAARRWLGAGRLLLQGKTPAQAAATVGAPRQPVYRWLDVLNAIGLDALRVTSKGGRSSRLEPERHEELRCIVLAGPRASGFGTELWTSRRVRETIQRGFGVRYSEVRLWRLLKRLGFSSQKPERRPRSATKRPLRAGRSAPGRH